MRTQMELFLDIDGVLADFTSACAKAHNKQLPFNSPSHRGHYDLAEAWGITASEFWKPLTEDQTFWHNLEKTSEADPLLDIIENKLNIKPFLCSSPSIDPYCYQGKAHWIRSHYPHLLTRTILTNHKHFLAKRNHILVDDSDRNINEFKKAGGIGILFPRLWNSRHALSNDPLKFVKLELNRFVR